MDSKFFRLPFANSGDKATVPDASQVDGSVSYDTGYGTDYSLDPQASAFLGSISGVVLTVTQIAYGALFVGSVLTGPGITAGTKVTAFGTGTGGVGTYTVQNSQTISSELIQGTANPDALLIERNKFNQLMNDITKSLNRLQTFFAPQWITSADNGGTAYPYAKDAIVVYNGVVYQSLAAANVAIPTDVTKWVVFLSNFATITALNAEALARQQADALLSNQIAAETARATGAEGTLTTNLAAEVTRATNAENLRATIVSLNAETTARQAADALLAPKLNPVMTGDVGMPTRLLNDNTDNGASTKWVNNQIAAQTGYKASYSTGFQDFADGGTLGPFTHILKVADVLLGKFAASVSLKCKSADAGYSIAQIVPTGMDGNDDGRGLSVAFNASGTQFSLFISSQGINVMNATAPHGRVKIDATKWQICVVLEGNPA